MIPKALRDRLGLRAGEVEVVADGTGLRVEAIPGEGIVKRGGRFVIPSVAAPLGDADVRELRDGDQR